MDWGSAVGITVGVAAALAGVVQGLREARRDRERQLTLLGHSPSGSGTGSDTPSEERGTVSSRPLRSNDLGADANDRPPADGEEAEDPSNLPHEIPEAEFRRLWDEAQGRLEKYHELAVIQGRQSFRMLLLFSALGFGLLVFVVWKATEVESAAGGVALGAAGTAGTALTAYIGRTFMRAYQDANERLIDYFKEPLHMSRLLASERLLNRMKETQRDEAIRRIIANALTFKDGSASERRRRDDTIQRPEDYIADSPP